MQRAARRRARTKANWSSPTVPSFAQHWLVPRLGSFRAAHPYTGCACRRVAGRGFPPGRERRRHSHGAGALADVAQQKLFDDEMVVVAAPHFAWRDGRLPSNAAEVLACPLISSPDTPWHDWCRAAQVAEPAEGAVVLSANDSNIVIGAVLQGQGVALERRRLVADALARGELVQITDIRVPYRYPYWLVWQQREMLNASQAHFAQWIEGQVDTYLHSSGALAATACGLARIRSHKTFARGFRSAIFVVPISDRAGNHEAPIHVALRPIFAACTEAWALRRRLSANLIDPTGENNDVVTCKEIVRVAGIGCTERGLRRAGVRAKRRRRWRSGGERY